MIRRLLSLAVVVAALTVGTPGIPAQARACQYLYYCTTTYFADSSRTTVVGQLTEDCLGRSFVWGKRSGYVTFAEVPC